MICLEEWRVVLRPGGAGNAGWEIVAANNPGKC